MKGDPLPPELRAFLHGETEAANFHHADHVRMAFKILRRHPDFLQAANAYATALKGIATRAGNPGAYHETMTIAFLALIAERRAACADDDFGAFARTNGDLFDKSVLTKWYPPARLQSTAARATFILPSPRAP